MEYEIKQTGLESSLSEAFFDKHISCVVLKPPNSYSMCSVYYDFPDSFLSKSGISLRFRLQNGNGFINVKKKATGSSGILCRDEWECPCNSLSAGLAALKADEDVKRMLTRDSACSLMPVAAVEFLRTSQIVLFNGAKIEISLDRGFFNNDRENRFAELETELISGDPGALEALAAYLTGKYGLYVEHSTKLARALCKRTGSGMN